MRIDNIETVDVLSVNNVKEKIGYFSKLPNEVILKIFENLQPSELCQQMGLTCKFFYHFGKDDNLWKIFRNQLRMNSQLEEGQSHRQAYIEPFVVKAKLYKQSKLENLPVANEAFNAMPFIFSGIDKIDFSKNPFLQIEEFEKKDGKQHRYKAVYKDSLFIIAFSGDRKFGVIYKYQHTENKAILYLLVIGADMPEIRQYSSLEDANNEFVGALRLLNEDLLQGPLATI